MYLCCYVQSESVIEFNSQFRRADIRVHVVHTSHDMYKDLQQYIADTICSNSKMLFLGK